MFLFFLKEFLSLFNDGMDFEDLFVLIDILVLEKYLGLKYYDVSTENINVV